MPRSFLAVKKQKTIKETLKSLGLKMPHGYTVEDRKKRRTKRGKK